MDQVNDHHNPRYYDGSAGGWFPLFYWRMAGTAAGRREIGYNQGKRDAAKIIAELERDKTNGNIIETIKIVTHSMGGAFAKGFVQALREYIATLPAEIQQQIRISFVADFDPYEGRDIAADGITPTFQFIHYGTLANQKEKGKVQQMTSNSTSKKHSIFSFFKDISQLKEGSYSWNEKTQEWDFQGK
jgi:hypothetical protein